MDSQNDAAITLAIVLLGVAAAFFLWILFTKV
jgi:hypothetical protein